MKYKVLEKLKSIPYSDNQVDLLETLFNVDPALIKEYEDELSKLYQSWVDFGNNWDKKYDDVIKRVKQSHWDNLRTKVYETIGKSSSKDPKIITAEFITKLKDTGDLFLPENVNLEKTDITDWYKVEKTPFKPIIKDDVIIALDYPGHAFLNLGFEFMGKLLVEIKEDEKNFLLKLIDD